MDTILKITRPAKALPLVFDSPHSGTVYPDDFNYACDFRELESAEDKYVEDLFSSTPLIGATFMQANFPRSYIDVNRRYDDIEPELLGDDPWTGPFPALPSPRAHAGIGLIRRLVRPGVPVYDRLLSTAEIMHRLEYYYRPYHETLETLIAEAHYNYGQIWHINCHSMPNSSAYPRQALNIIGNKPRAADFVIGDRDGTTCSIDLTRALKEFLKSLGYFVTVNDPFKGVELIEKFSDPANGYHSLQIEINKSLYMNEETGERTSNYNKLKDDIEKMNHFIASYISARLIPLAAD